METPLLTIYGAAMKKFLLYLTISTMLFTLSCTKDSNNDPVTPENPDLVYVGNWKFNDVNINLTISNVENKAMVTGYSYTTGNNTGVCTGDGTNTEGYTEVKESRFSLNVNEPEFNTKDIEVTGWFVSTGDTLVGSYWTGCGAGSFTAVKNP